MVMSISVVDSQDNSIGILLILGIGQLKNFNHFAYTYIL